LHCVTAARGTPLLETSFQILILSFNHLLILLIAGTSIIVVTVYFFAEKKDYFPGIRNLEIMKIIQAFFLVMITFI
ncbi:MAG TPA: hypothetical protein VEF33_13890, partial [Syntrophales bacterium]|nr:hypothetical protein [Syntrophales bacterium]